MAGCILTPSFVPSAKARGDFPVNDKKLVTELCDLLFLYCNTGGDRFKAMEHEAADSRIKAIGQQLYEDGGHARMLAIHACVNDHCNGLGKYGMGRVLESRWGGVGEWRA